MTRQSAVIAIALLLTTSSLACAAETSPTVGVAQPTTDLKALTEMRVGIVKAALQLTPDQEKYWPAIEDAIRGRAKNRQARLERIAELHENGPMGVLGDGSPIELMQRRADRLIQRGTDLKKLADAWEPLYKTLSGDQKRRMAFVSFAVMRGMRDAIEHHDEPVDEDE
jgi:hypothetical protein